MKLYQPVIAIVVLVLTLSVTPLAAQSTGGDQSGATDDEEHDTWMAVAMGGGLLNGASRNRTFLEASLRFDASQSERRLDDDNQGFIEVDLSTWSSSSSSDLRLGLNIVAVDSNEWSADFFYGAGIAMHLIEAEATVDDTTVTASDEVLGINVHSGVDVWMLSDLSLYGRFTLELLDDSDALDVLAGGEAGDTDVFRLAVGTRFRF